MQILMKRNAAIGLGLAVLVGVILAVFLRPDPTPANPVPQQQSSIDPLPVTLAETAPPETKPPEQESSMDSDLAEMPPEITDEELEVRTALRKGRRRRQAKIDEVRAETWGQSVENLVFQDYIPLDLISQMEDPHGILGKVNDMVRVQKLLGDDARSNPALVRAIQTDIEYAGERYLTELPPYNPSRKNYHGQYVVSTSGMAAAAYVYAQLEDNAYGDSAIALRFVVDLHSHYQNAKLASALEFSTSQLTENEYIFSAEGFVFAEAEFMLMERLIDPSSQAESSSEISTVMAEYQELISSNQITVSRFHDRMSHQDQVFQAAKELVALIDGSVNQGKFGQFGVYKSGLDAVDAVYNHDVTKYYAKN